mmetsp:Transcript_67277/g.217383  ORF Transcript_67277/g.217383 Transcript_67277/m.217383 type:complete len:172 (+) Transcript_67277:111-626(+)
MPRAMPESTGFAVARPMNATGRPFQDDMLWSIRIDKEWAQARRTMPAAQGGGALRPSAGSFRVPRSGDEVTVWGLRDRSELNGARGEVLGASLDSSGRVEVRVFTSEGSRKMRIQPRRLFTSSASSPSLLQDDGGDARSAFSVGAWSGSGGSAGLAAQIISVILYFGLVPH